jgi:hypothetical protein
MKRSAPKLHPAVAKFVRQIMPLIAHPPPGEEWIGQQYSNDKLLRAVCRSCGATDKRIMMKTHREDCAWIGYWHARQVLADAVELLVKKRGKESR